MMLRDRREGGGKIGGIQRANQGANAKMPIEGIMVQIAGHCS